MAIVLDTSIVIAGERRRQTVKEILSDIEATFGNADAVLSSVTAVELTHGIARARNATERTRRQLFHDELFRDTVVYPVTLEVAQLAGRIEGEQAALGNIIALADLLIGATALHLGFAVATLNMRHFRRIPGLDLVTL